MLLATRSPFSHRVWIALEAKGQPYQYIETDPFKRPASTPLLEANPRGRVPAIRQGDWACSESAVILEYVRRRYELLICIKMCAYTYTNIHLLLSYY